MIWGAAPYLAKIEQGDGYEHYRSSPDYPDSPRDTKLQAKGNSQSAIRNPVTRLNSLVLCEMRVALWARATAAMRVSFGPMGVPCVNRSAWICP